MATRPTASARTHRSWETAALHRLSSVRLTAPQVESTDTDVTLLDDSLADTAQALNAQRAAAALLHAGRSDAGRPRRPVPGHSPQESAHAPWSEAWRWS
ncbi:hypothetical protein [Streptomyces mirabilis]|uniref:hypothetical protein n=1 Tax=Streptomyces mirabilis TaxID=68239 RepID=UPI002259CEC5|nr:hypothetical protein [Streptomyces mirabilis]MCX4426368.1 hypothetical protein [Streptomyces mirabilis]